MLRVAALQYCASDDVAKTLHHIQPLIAEAASKASLIALPECANYLAASREQLFQKAEWDDESYSQKWFGNEHPRKLLNFKGFKGTFLKLRGFSSHACKVVNLIFARARGPSMG